MASNSNLPTSSSSSISDRARRLAARSGSAPAADTPASSVATPLPTIPDTSTTVPATTTDGAGVAPAATVQDTTVTIPPETATTGQEQTSASAATSVDSTQMPVVAVQAASASVQPPPPATAQAAVDAAAAKTNTTPVDTDTHGNFPPLPSPSFTVVESHAERRKRKGKDKERTKSTTAATTTATAPAPPPSDSEEPAEVRAMRRSLNRLGDREEAESMTRAISLSLGYPPNSTTPGASGSRTFIDVDANDTPDSPPKRQRADTTGRARPIPEPSPEPARRRVQERDIEHHTLNGLPPRGSFTPRPEGGFHLPHGISATTLFRNLPPTQLRQWDNEPHPKLLARVSGGNGERVLTERLLRTAVADFFNARPTDLRIGPPGSAAGPGPDPNVWLIGGLPIEQAQTLIDWGMLSSDGITVFFFAYSPPVSDFYGTFNNLTVQEDDSELATAIICDAIAADPAVARFVRSHRDAFPPYFTADEALARFAESLHARSIPLLTSGGTTITAWNVYGMSPTDSEEHHTTLRNLIATLRIDTAWNGEARIYLRPLLCHICGSIDHPTNICPLPRLPGWLGATPETIGALEETSRNVIGRGTKGKPGRDNSKSNGKGKRDERKGGKDNRRK